jgi:hypothetical protein
MLPSVQNASCTEQTFAIKTQNASYLASLEKIRTNLAMPSQYKQESEPQVFTQSSSGKTQKAVFFYWK